MATSFNVNIGDLEFILKQIKIAEATSLAYTNTPLSQLEAIRNVYGQDITLENAALLPFGLRTVDGSNNHLLPGQELFGAADTLFPRLTDPVFAEPDTEDPFFGITNTDYSVVGPGANVVDTDPRIISNLIVDMTAGNPAAVEAALKYSVFSGAIAPEDAAAAAAAIAAAYAQTVSARQAAALGGLGVPNPLYTIPAHSADLSDDAAAAVVTAINTIGSAIFGAPVDQTDIDNAAAAIAAAQAAVAAANALSADLNAIPDPLDPAALATLTAARIAAATQATNAGNLLTALQTYQTNLGGLGATVDPDDLAAVMAAATSAAANLTSTQALTTTLSGLADPYGVAAADAALAAALATYSIEVDPSGSLVIPNIAPDAGLTAPFNAWMTFFGQFFDHGLDLVTKGGSGAVFIPLEADDPLIAGADGIFGNADDLPPTLRFMVLTRATVTMVDPDGAGPLAAVPQHENTTTSWIDQNQTYTSHESHQAFLREYVRIDVNGDGQLETRATGHLLESSTLSGAPGTWADVKAQARVMLGIILTDSDVHNVPLLATDQYGQLLLGPNGYAQVVTSTGLVEGQAGGIALPANTVRTGHAFLNDIAHLAAPGTGQTGDADNVVGNNDGIATTYDDELLDAHFITGDGRGNENIALTAVHSVFHAEHNRVLEANKATLLANASTPEGLAFLNEWLLVDVAAVPADLSTLVWDGERLFQAARFTTEMQYQHLVFEEFARRIQPDVDPFVFNPDVTIDGSILAEFAHTVYRFGHSMLTGTVDRLENDLTGVGQGNPAQAALLDAFLNPVLYTQSGTSQEDILANIVRGTSRDVGNAIDEFIVQDLRSNLLGLPLDLAVLNIARGRDTGIPSLNETRAQLHAAGVLHLTPYANWLDFMNNGLNNKLSVINFIAAYGTHTTITNATTLEARRDAAIELVTGVDANGDGIVPAENDRLAFLNATGIYADGDLGGLNNIDLWIGGLAEKRPEFGSAMLGQTFNYIFEYQMEHLQFGDRFYYLSRTQGTNFLNQLEPNTFADLVMRNSALGGDYATHLSSALFLTPDFVLELDRGIAQEDYNLSPLSIDPDWDIAPSVPVEKVSRNYSSTIADPNDPTHDFGGSIIFRGAEHIVIGGTEGNDYIQSDEGDDTIWGDGGNDHLISGAGVDSVFGGDGDDIIEDNEGVGDFLRGERGNDVIVAARGLDVLFGGEGKDFIQIQLDAMEVFAGEGDDFVLGGEGVDLLMGNEGNDWIEGAGGFDTLAGENSELFFNSPVIGHDVLIGGGDESDYDSESGDDIMVSAGGTVQRMEGMFGFDWGAAKNDVGPVDFDLSKPFFTSDPADILRDRFDLVEALSGWNFDDKLTGDDRGTTVADPLTGVVPTLPDPLAPSGLFVNNVLDAEGIARIDGLGALVNPAMATLGLTTSFHDGNILLGGDGSDTLMGKGGFDILDGDAWLNVRIKITVNGQVYSAESLSTDTAINGPHAGLVFNTIDGSPDFTSPAFGGRSLQSLLLDRTINPGQMEIVREILQDTTSGDIDTAVFRGNFDEYQVEGSTDLNGDGDFVDVVNGVSEFAVRDVNLDGFISVRDLAVNRPAPVGAPIGGGTFLDDLDLLKNIEQLQFADQLIDLTRINWNGVRPAEGTLPAIGATIATLSLAADPTATFARIDGTAQVTVSATGVVTTTAANFAGTLTVQATAASGEVVENTITIRTGTAGDDAGVTALNGNGFTDVIYALGGNDVVNGLGGHDTLFGQAGNDTLNGGLGNDALTGGTGADLVNGEAGNDTIHYRIGDGVDTMDGGLGTDTLSITDVAGGDNTLDVRFDVVGDPLLGLTRLTSVEGGAISNFEFVNADMGDNADTLSYAGSNTGVIVALADAGISGTASGFTQLINVTNVVGTDHADTISGNNEDNQFTGGLDSDTLLGDSGDDTLIGGAGNDTVNGEADNDTIHYTIGDGVDTVNGGEDAGNLDIDRLIIRGTADLATISNETLNVIYNGTLTGFEDGTVAGVELVDADLGAGTGDTLDYTGSTVAVAVNLGAGTASGFNSIANIENVIGGSGGDTIQFALGNVAGTVDGGIGTDTFAITGTGGANTLTVAFDGARITTAAGNTLTNIEQVTADLLGGTDTLSYGTTTAGVTVNLALNQASGFASIANIENVTGGLGDDTFIAANDNVRATLNGNLGTDTADYSAYAANLSVTLSAATIVVNGSGSNAANSDVLQNIENFIGGSGGDTITGSLAANVLNGGAGDDILRAAANAANIDNLRDTLNGGAGTDTASYSAYTAALTVDLGAAEVVVGGSGSTVANSDVLVSIENFTGSQVSDSITGSGVANTLNGLDGIDTLRGGGGNDTIFAGFGSDIIYGGAGADTIDTGGLDNNAGNTIINGGGADRIRYEATGDYGDTITSFQVDAGVNSDRFQFAIALNDLFDDGINNNQISFISGNNANGTVIVQLGVINNVSGTTEALFLSGVRQDEGVLNTSLRNTGDVAAAFNNEFVITAADGEETLLVINDNNGTDAAVYQWVQTAGGTAEVDAAELTLIAFIDANGTVTQDLFGFI